MHIEGNNMTLISAKEAMRNESTRLEVYRLAVQNGFYNESPGTVGYKGFQLLPEGDNVHVFQRGYRLITMAKMRTAKLWVTCRVNKCELVQANEIVDTE